MAISATIVKIRSAPRLVGASVPQRLAMIYRGKLEAPGKDESGDYLWSEEDRDRARDALSTDRRRLQ